MATSGQPSRPCELCEAAHITPWFYEDAHCWIAECEICAVPMAVWKEHGTEPPAHVATHMQARLLEVAEQHFGSAWLDDHMRNIPAHYHVHARPLGGFFGRDFPRRA